MTNKQLSTKLPNPDLPCVSQTQDIQMEDCDIDGDSDASPFKRKLSYISDSSEDNSITSQANESIAHNVEDAFQPINDEYHALLSHKYIVMVNLSWKLNIRQVKSNF